MIQFIKKILGIHNHEFNSWKTYNKGDIEYQDILGFKGKIGHYYDQKRTCKICGYSQYKRNKITLN